MKACKPSLIRAAFELKPSLISQFIDLANTEGVDSGRQARDLLDQRAPHQCRYPACCEVLPSLPTVLRGGSMQVSIEARFGNSLERVLNELRAPEAQQLLLAVANLHFKHRTSLRPVLLELRPSVNNATPPRRASVRILTLQHRSVDLHTLGRITKSISTFLLRKDQDE
jgi:hypothetical protein